MTVLVVGGGAVGSLLGFALRRSGREIAIVDRRATTPGSRDIAVVDPAGQRQVQTVQTVPEPSALDAPPAAIVFAVKLFDLEAALRSCEAWPEVPVVTAQNGIGAEEMAAQSRPGAPVIAASLTAAVEWTESGDLGWVRRGGIGLAASAGPIPDLLDGFIDDFTHAGIPARRYPQGPAMKWSKLLGNLVGNATAAILDMDVGAIYRHAGLFRLEHAQLDEALSVVRALGLSPVALPGADVRMLLRALRLPDVIARPLLARILAGARGGKDPSLLLHVRSKGPPSEVDWMNGAVARTAAAAGVSSPVNRRLTELVNEILVDPGRREWFRHRPERLIDAVSSP